jgi:hypothetical protein
MIELATTVGVALLFTLLAMWAAGPAASCELAPEPHRRLNLDRLVDREHLATDVREIARLARRYVPRTAPAGGIDQTIAECEEKLDGQLVTAHDVTIEQVRSATTRER